MTESGPNWFATCTSKEYEIWLREGLAHPIIEGTNPPTFVLDEYRGPHSVFSQRVEIREPAEPSPPLQKVWEGRGQARSTWYWANSPARFRKHLDDIDAAVTTLRTILDNLEQKGEGTP